MRKKYSSKRGKKKRRKLFIPYDLCTASVPSGSMPYRTRAWFDVQSGSSLDVLVFFFKQNPACITLAGFKDPLRFFFNHTHEFYEHAVTNVEKRWGKKKVPRREHLESQTNSEQVKTENIQKYRVIVS